MTKLSPETPLLYIADFPGRAGIARVRFHAMDVSSVTWAHIAKLAAEFGSGDVQIVDDGDLEIGQVSDPEALTAAARELGWPVHTAVPGPVVAFSPMSGRSGGWADIRDLYTELASRATGLPVAAWSPFFGLDDGRGDIAALKPTVGVIADEPDRFRLILDGEATADHVAWDDVVDRMVAEYEQRLAGPAPTIKRELEIVDSTAAVSALRPGLDLVGWLAQEDGKITLGAGLRFGELTSEVVQLLAATEAAVTVTPWRSILIHDLDEHEAESVLRVLAPRGLVFDQESPWLRVSACPHCHLSLSNTEGDAETAVHSGDLPAGRVHFAGCDMRCGLPRGNFIEYLALADGEYEVSSTS
ncbi:hypothetical protein [Corynebacterium ulceribovis]|uniref:hypothetical protein n=1 Tax=Corynebacterium ulceribovis TaxID=487732 RepID=UPI00037B3055|nr:hypothetical protein [Corynebacterium ulceribovis]